MHFKTLRRKLGEFIFPDLTRMTQRMDGKLRFMSHEYEAMRITREQLRQLLSQIEEAKREIQASEKDIVIQGPVVFLGSLSGCQVKLQPNIHQKFVLGQVDMDSLLSVNGNHQTVKHCTFENNTEKNAASVTAFMKENLDVQ